jgi:hypothetical protein
VLAKTSSKHKQPYTVTNSCGSQYQKNQKEKRKEERKVYLVVVARVVGCSGMIYPQRRGERAEATNPREIAGWWAEALDGGGRSCIWWWWPGRWERREKFWGKRGKWK